MSKAFYIDSHGAKQEVSGEKVIEALTSGKHLKCRPQEALNQVFSDADLKIGPAFDQIRASLGITMTHEKNPFGLRQASMSEILDGYGVVSNTAQNQTPFGTASKYLFPITVIAEIESKVQKDRMTDTMVFDRMVANRLSVTTEHFEQPVIDYGTLGGPEQVKAGRASQGALPPKMLTFKTADRIRRIGSWTLGMEWTEQALRATSLDFVAMTTARYLQVERDERVYRYISNLFNGDGDLVVGAVSAVTSTSLDSAATGGVLTHKAWLKFLARNRKFRKITHAICDLDTYLKIESRTGRPGTNNYDPTLARIDPQAMVMNNTFGQDVEFFIVDSATDGGPVPANTVYGVDASSAITMVTNTSAIYSAVESYAMKRTESVRMDWSEEVFRTFGDSELTPFDVLTIS